MRTQCASALRHKVKQINTANPAEIEFGEGQNQGVGVMLGGGKAQAFALTECADPILIRKVSQHPDIASEVRLKYSQLASKMTSTNGAVSVHYVQHYSGIGRFIPEEFGAIQMSGRARSTIYGATMIDLDQVSSQPSHLLNICRDLHFEQEWIQWLCEYVADKSAFAEKHNLTISQIKDFVIVVCCFGGDIGDWVSRDCKITGTPIQLSEEIVDIADKARAVREMIMCKKPWGAEMDLTLSRRATKQDVHGNSYVHGRSKLAHYLQHLETIETMKFSQLCKDNGVDMRVYCYDGFCVDADKREIVQQLIDQYNQTSSIKWAIKDWKEPLTFEGQDLPFDINKWDEEAPYAEQKAYFEQSNFVLANRLGFCYERTDDGYEQYEVSKACSLMYSNVWTTQEIDGKKKRSLFFKRWIADKDRLQYKGVDFYPPGLPCPRDHFNTWTAPKITSIPLVDYDSWDPRQSMVIQHFHSLSGGDKAMEDYNLRLWAWKTQFPGAKTQTANVFVSVQGAGKTTFLENLGNLCFGENRVMTTTKISDICGEFSLMANKILVIYDEPDGRDTHECQNQLKFVITTSKQMIGEKHVQKRMQQTPGHIILCSNNIGGKPVATTNGERRWVIAKSQMPKCICDADLKASCPLKNKKGGCQTYFRKLYAGEMSFCDSTKPTTPGSPQEMRRVYEYFKRMKLDGFSPMNIPRSEYHESLIEDSKPNLLAFHDELCRVFHNDRMMDFADFEKLPIGTGIGVRHFSSLFKQWMKHNERGETDMKGQHLMRRYKEEVVEELDGVTYYQQMPRQFAGEYCAIGRQGFVIKVLPMV